MDENFKTTVSHVVIRAWAENHHGQPALIVDPNHLDQQVGLRIDFPGKHDEALLSAAHHNKVVSWDEFFQVFEEQQLAFDYLEEPGETDLVDAYRFLKREVLAENEKPTPFNPDDFAKAIRDGEPAFFTHGGTEENPRTNGEEELSGSATAPETDDDTTLAAKEVGYTEPDDPQVKHDQG